jgi:DNA-directed RNA polymerase sigma subunit (sigma70/sigma32)
VSSLDAPVFGELSQSEFTTMVDVVTDDAPTVEEVVANAETEERLSSFQASLSAEDREIILSENSQRVRSRRYLSLVERATAFVRGKDADTTAPMPRLVALAPRLANTASRRPSVAP